MKSIYFWTAVAVYAFVSWLFQFSLIANVVAVSLVLMYGLYDFFESFFVSVERDMHDLRREVAFLKRELNMHDTYTPLLQPNTPSLISTGVQSALMNSNSRRDLHPAI